MEFEKEIRTVREQIRDAEKRHADGRAEGEKLVAEMRDAGVDVAKDAEAFEKVDAAFRDADAARDEVATLRTREARLLEIAGEKIAEGKNDTETREALSVADAYLRSNEYRSLRESGVLEMSGAQVRTAPVRVMTRDQAMDMLRMRATVDNSLPGGGGRIWSDRRESLVVESPFRRIRLLDVITIGSTDTDTIEWAIEQTPTDAAAETPYGTAVPEASYAWDKTSTTVRRLGHFVPATKGALADGAQLRTLLENRLVRGVRARVESQVLSGDGTGENLKGITNTSGIGALDAATSNAGAAEVSRFDALHKAITKIRIATEGDEPSVVAMSPGDFETILLEKDANGNFRHGRPISEGPLQTIWGLVPVVSTLIPDGTPLVGDFSQATLFVREGVSVAASDSHSDFFLKGLVAILAEMRAAFAVLQPKAFCQVSNFDDLSAV